MALHYLSESATEGVADAPQQARLLRGITRGDGAIGEDVSSNVRTIRSVRSSLTRRVSPRPGLPAQFEVRGEVVMPISGFLRMNEERESQGLAPAANPRNAAAGTIRTLEPIIVAQRRLDFYAYFALDANGEPLFPSQRRRSTRSRQRASA